MNIEETITPELCLLGGKASSRKKALQLISDLFFQINNQVDSFSLLKAMVSREQLGSTAIGNGVALPHGRIKECKVPQAALITLEDAIDFSAPDKEKVDIIFALIVPFEHNFKDIIGLDNIVQVFSDKKICAQMRNAHNNEALYEIFLQANTLYSKGNEE